LNSRKNVVSIEKICAYFKNEITAMIGSKVYIPEREVEFSHGTSE
jgi:hypothetical protein